MEGHSISKQFVLTQFLKSGISLTPHFKIGAHELLLEFAFDALNSGQLQELKLKEPLPKRAIGYIHQKQFPLSNAAQSFLSLIPKL